MVQRITAANRDIDTLLENTVPRPAPAHAPTPPARKPFNLSFREWASSQVAAYRVGLLLSYLSMMYFGGTSFYAGIPTFQFTTPEGWTPIWATGVVIGGFVGAIGSLKAGAEPLTKSVRRFNRTELTGAILLFLTLGTYAAILLTVGYGYGDPGRTSIGSGFVALGVAPAIRMIWLIFRPRFLALMRGHHTIATGPVVLVPRGYAVFRVDEHGNPLPNSEKAPEATPGLEGA
jgi:hypothetical protein